MIYSGSLLRGVYPGTPTEDQSHYPTDFSRGNIPILCHSHNDYERKVPLYNTLQAGYTSVEADVWLHDGDLLVGHTGNSLIHRLVL